MNKAKTLLLSSALTISGIFAAHAQTAANDDKLVAMNDPVKTDVAAKKVGLEKPEVRQVGYNESAITLSSVEDAIVIRLTGGNFVRVNGKLMPEKPVTDYANMLSEGFRNKDIAGTPVNVIVLWSPHDPKLGQHQALALIYMDGEDYENLNGQKALHPYFDLGANNGQEIKNIVQQYKLILAKAGKTLAAVETAAEYPNLAANID